MRSRTSFYAKAVATSSIGIVSQKRTTSRPELISLPCVCCFELIPQTVGFGVLSWKKGTRRAGWVARGWELGVHADADLSWGPADQVTRGSEERAPTQSPTQRAPGPDRESAGLQNERYRAPRPDTDRDRVPGAHTEHCMRSPNRVHDGVRLGCLFLMPASLRFGPSAHVLGMRNRCGCVVSYSGQHCASKVLKQKLRKKSPSPPIHAQRSADLSAVQRSRGRVFLWRTIP